MSQLMKVFMTIVALALILTLNLDAIAHARNSAKKRPALTHSHSV